MSISELADKNFFFFSDAKKERKEKVLYSVFSSSSLSSCLDFFIVN